MTTVLVVFLLLSGINEVFGQCDQKYRNADPNHSVCLQRSGNYKSGSVSDADKKAIVDEHNKLRSKAAKQFNAANMMTMAWDDEIAAVAQKWAENCKFAHDQSSQRVIPAKYNTGQNIAMGGIFDSWQKAINAWYDEVKDFTYGGHPRGVVGHFTQVTWATSVKVGCGFADCRNVKNFYVCNYAPAGNSYDSANKPWESGSKACSGCPGKCKDGLCDCGGKVCFNDGKLKADTCTCECKDDTFDPDQCKMDCSKMKDKFYCAKWGSYECKQYSNAPSDCPHLCKVCP